MSELIYKNASELAQMLQKGEVSSVELTQAHLDRTAAVDGAVHSYLHVGPEAALAAAKDVDRRRAAGEKLYLRDQPQQSRVAQCRSGRRAVE